MNKNVSLTRILFFGDSNTYGFDPRGIIGDRYPASLRWTEHLRRVFAGRCEFFFDGVNGRMIPAEMWGYRELQGDLERFGAPDHLAVMLGSNDLFLTAAPSSAKIGKRMRTLVHRLLAEETLSKYGTRLLLVVPPAIAPSASEDDPLSIYRQVSLELAQEYRQIARECPGRVQVLDTTGWEISMAYDRVHLSEKGCRQFGEQMAKALETLLSDDRLRWEPVSVEHLVQDRWLDLRKVEYRFPDGSTFTPYYNYSRRSYVVIAASDEEGRFLCVRQFRHGIGEVTTEFPAGGIECSGASEYPRPDSSSVNAESALETAKRELEEETGYTSDDWSFLMAVPSNATIADNYAYLFRARNCRRTTAPHTDDSEFLETRTLSPGEIEDLIAQGQFQQAIHILTWLLVKQNEN